MRALGVLHDHLLAQRLVLVLIEVGDVNLAIAGGRERGHEDGGRERGHEGGGRERGPCDITDSIA
jgi:hypothetical protein